MSKFFSKAKGKNRKRGARKTQQTGTLEWRDLDEDELEDEFDDVEEEEEDFALEEIEEDLEEIEEEEISVEEVLANVR